ncbi:MAG: hypothetical protein EPO68_13025 [Planctomycetota bacterium]|nr:MAG: hypothetical protein EPO68_13025 [Planctomycetota bacterium]
MSATPVPHWRDRALLCAGFLALYAALGQDVFYKTDGLALVAYARGGPLWGAVHHALYLPLLHAFDLVVAPLTGSAYRSAVLLSALGTALGVAFAHAGGLRLGFDRARAALFAALVGCAPAVLFFATVVEYHGLFFGAAGLAFWALTRAAERPTPARALALGLATYLAASVHATGHLLPALTCTWLLALRFPLERARALVAPCIAGAVHVALLFGVPALTRAFGNAATPESQAGFLAQQQFAPLDLPLAFAREWLLAFAPLSLLALWPPRDAKLRLEWYALLVALVPYLLASWALNTGFNTPERGAYWLPLALPAARLAIAQLPRTGAVLLALACAAAGIFQVVRHDDPSASRAWLAGFDAARQGKPAVLLIGHSNEAAALLVERPEQEYVALDFLRTLAPETLAAYMPKFMAVTERWKSERERVYITASARELLALVEPRCGPAFRQWLEHAFDVLPVESGSFRGEWLVPKR